MLAKRELLADSLKGNAKGGIYENLVAGILVRNGFPIRHYKNDDCEVEFIVETEAGVIPIEVKSSTGRTRSLDWVLAEAAIPFGIKFTGGNVGVADRRITLPHYMAMFLRP